jgi:hypothetical protein
MEHVVNGCVSVVATKCFCQKQLNFALANFCSLNFLFVPTLLVEGSKEVREHLTNSKLLLLAIFLNPH